MRKSWIIIVLFLFTACSTFRQERIPDFSSNGERIYFTATSESGSPITSTGGTSMMMSGTQSCNDCHGTTAQGGERRVHMDTMDVPDIRWSALLGEDDDEHDDAHSDSHTGYTIETFRQAITEGQHPDGTPLDSNMPRWTMSDEDLADLVEYLQSLD